MQNKCSVQQCLRPASHVGLCDGHYQRTRLSRSGLSPETPLKVFARDVPEEKLREVVPVVNCWAHLSQHLGFKCKVGTGVTTLRNRVRALGIDTSHFIGSRTKCKCAVTGCVKIASGGRGYCHEHYGYLKRNGDPLKKIVLRKKRYNVGGYIMLDVPSNPFVTSKGGRIFEHRLIMSQILGRPLRPDEQVHHKNGQRHDNSPGNLELWSKNQPIGGRVKDLVAWAKQIVALYGEDETKY